MKNVLVVGGGAIGLFSAYYLQKKGHLVTVIDRNDFTNGCSFGNAGFVVPSHIVPMASPGYVRTGIKMAFNPNAPLAFNMPPSVDFLKWTTRFYFAATKSHVEASIPVLKELCLYSQSLYKQISNEGSVHFKYNEKGLLMLYTSKHIEHEETQGAALALKHGIDAKVLTANDVRQIEPHASKNIRGAVHYTGDTHLDAQQMMQSIYAHLASQGVRFVSHAGVKKFVMAGNRCTEIETTAGNITFDDMVIATGAWSHELLKMLHTHVWVQPGRGYSFKIRTDQPIAYPALLADARVAVCPLNEQLVRFSGGMELGYFNNKVSNTRIELIKRAIGTYYTNISDVTINESDIWQGHRPCSFDGLPYIDKVPGYDNITVATGHSMLGITLAPATGELIAQLVSSQKPSIVLKPFRIGR